MKPSNRKKILVIAAHPDDEVLGCGGTIAKFKKKGADVYVYFLAEGITARYLQQDFNSKRVKEEIFKRNQDCLKALSILGVKKNDIEFENNFCCRLDQVPLIDLVKKIEEKILIIKPNIIFTHWHNDLNIDHKIVNHAVRVATRPINKNFIEEILSFEVLSSTEWSGIEAFNPNYFVDISNFINIKCKSFNKYTKEVRSGSHPRNSEHIKALAKYRGGQAGYKFAESFSLIKKFIK